MPRGVQMKTNYDIMISNRSYRDLDRPVRVPTGTQPDPTRPVDRCRSNPTGSVSELQYNTIAEEAHSHPVCEGFFEFRFRNSFNGTFNIFCPID